ncbi:MAG: hypothetical protein PHI85_00265 [Victivallaceae bacterium]|nr:hypothetical protein [Victivallaceae bacterium]
MLYLVSKDGGDFAVLLKKYGVEFKVAATLAHALRTAKAGDGVAVLCDEYPAPRRISANWKAAAQNGVRLFLEFPRTLDGVEFATGISEPGFERTVTTDNNCGLEKCTILAQHGAYLREVKTPVTPLLAQARVAGYRTAVFGLPEKMFPVLFRHPQYPSVLVANANFSKFITARFTPQPDWAKVIRFIISFLAPDAGLPKNPQWTMAVRPVKSAGESISAADELAAFKRNVEFISGALLANYHNTGLLIDEGYSAKIDHLGRQMRRQLTRGDCTGEVAMVFALDYKMTGNIQSRDFAIRLLDFLFTSDTLICLDKKSPVYGQLKFFEHTPAYYGDDNFRAIIGAALSAKLLGVKRWNKPILRNLHSVLNTTGKLGFRRDRLDWPSSFSDGKDLAFYQNEDFVLLRPHAQAYLFSGFMLGWKLTGEQKFLDYAKSAIAIMMKAYPKVHWTNGLSQEIARMLLPLAWLLRIEDTPEHREWLDRVAADVEKLSQPCGAIAETMGDLSMGDYPSPQSNEAYGTTEAALIQENGDPACDLLYTTNYAMIGLHEAAAASGSAKYAQMADKLAKFLCRIQVKSEQQPYLDGAWMRGFDWNLWDYYGSSADAGWGAWCIESGWTNNWIAATLALRKLNRSLWEML